jgi:DNA/RNA endonuclease YhcR with UshA esterase domain
MRRLAALLLGGCLAAPAAVAQAPPEPAPPAPAPPAAQAPAPQAPAGKAPEYDPKAVVTVKGIVADIHESKMHGDHPGLHLVLQTDTGTVEVHVCPPQFLSDLDFTIEKGDELTVEGSRPDPTGIVVAREITKGQTSLIVRDKTGAPCWTR